MERLANSRILTLTDGTPTDGADVRHHGFSSLEAYRAARQAELGCVLRDASLPETVLGIAPNVPVPDQTAALHLRELTAAVARFIRDFQPEAVLTHPYEGGHPDHDACAFVVHAAVRRGSRLNAETSMQASEPFIVPLILEAPFYHAGEDGSMRTGAFLSGATTGATLLCELSPEQQATKLRRLACFRSQAETLAQFEVRHELFRVAPRYDFTRPPHPGQLLYERFPWGMTGERFRELAALAQHRPIHAEPGLTASPA